MRSPLICLRTFIRLLPSRTFASDKKAPAISGALPPSPVTDVFDGYTRSSYVRLNYIELPTTETVKGPDGEPITTVRIKKVSTALVDNTHEWLGDQMTRIHMRITHDYDYTIAGFAERSRKRLLARNKQRQVITDEMINKRGSLDLAVAHMVCALGGRVQFVGGPSSHWHQCYNRGPPDLPPTCSDELKLEAIDLSGTPVMYEGLQYLPKLTHLRMLRLRRCLHLNDHCLSLVGQITQSPLEYLDISECPRITANGITALTELKSLKRLLVQGNSTLKDRELVCLLLEDYLPKVYIEGVDYLGNLPEDAKRRVLALDAPETPSGLLTEPQESPSSEPTSQQAGQEEGVEVAEKKSLRNAK